jgi:hypothetical protein
VVAFVNSRELEGESAPIEKVIPKPAHTYIHAVPTGYIYAHTYIQAYITHTHTHRHAVPIYTHTKAYLQNLYTHQSMCM